MTNEIAHLSLTVEFLLKTDSGYPKDTGVTLFTLATPGNPLPLATPGNPIPWQPLGIPFSTHQSAQLVSALANSRGPGTRQAEGLVPQPPRATRSQPDPMRTDSRKPLLFLTFSG